LAASGVDARQGQVVAKNLLWNDLVGRTNHGVQRLPILLRRVQKDLINRKCTPSFIAISDTAKRLDGDNGFGQYVGELAMRSAIEMAQATGTGMVGVSNSNFFGTGAYFVQMAAKQNMLGLAMSNSYAKVAAAGGVRPVLGTNPFAFGAPRQDGRSLLVDMSTAGLAGSTIRQHQATGDTLPEGLVIDSDGQPVTDPDKAATATLLPAAGAKGFGLALMVEMFSAVLTGAGMAGQVGSLYKDFDRVSQSGHFFLALDITRWMQIEEYFHRFDTLITMLKSSDEAGQVLLPGETRWAIWEDNKANGVPVVSETRDALDVLADSISVETPWQA